MPTELKCDSAAIEGTSLKLVASSYVHGARFGARNLSWLRVVEPLRLFLALHGHVMHRYLNTSLFLRTLEVRK